ncbi:RagB/SusD family nutrient uptake outer membrane protein, partial [Acinetobacter baumannii]
IVIKRANDVLNHVPSINMNAALKNRILGEAYFLNALMYFQLAYNYANDKAGIPIIDRQNPSSNAIPRPASIEDNYKAIEADLKSAAALLP